MLEKDTGGLCSITTLHHSHRDQFAHARKTISVSFVEFVGCLSLAILNTFKTKNSVKNSSS